MHTSTQILVSTRPVLLALVKGGPPGPPGPGAGSLTRLAFSSTTNTAGLGDAEIYACTDTSAARTLTVSTSTIQQGTPTLPSAITITDDSGGAGTNNITIETEDAQTIDGAPSAEITVGYGTISLVSDGSNLTSVGGSGKTNAVDRVPKTSDPSAVVDVYSVADLPDAITAPDGVLRVPLGAGVQYIVHASFVWPRMMLAIGAGVESTSIVGAAPLASTMLFSGDTTPHIWGRNISSISFREITFVDISNSGQGRGTVMFDLTGGLGTALFTLSSCGFFGFSRLGNTLDILSIVLTPTASVDIGGGMVTSFTGTFDHTGYPIIGATFDEGPNDQIALKPMWSFVGASPGIGINMGLGGFNMNASDTGLYIDPSFTGSLAITGMAYGGASSGDFFRADVNLGVVSEASADLPITSFAADTRSIISVTAALAGSTFSAGVRHNWRVGDTLTHSGFSNAGYNGTVTITSLDPFTYTASAVAFVSNDSGVAAHDLSTLVTSAGSGLYRGQTVLLGGAAPGAYAGLRVILAVEDDEDGFTIPVAFSVGGTGIIQITRVTTASNHPMVRGEQHTITGTVAYNGTRSILATPTDDTFDISAAFVTDEGVLGAVSSATLDEKATNVSAQGNGAQKDSKSIGSVVVNGNAATTVIAVANTWVDLNLGGLAVAGSNIERWGSVDATTGEVTYNDTSDFSGELLTSVSVTSQGGSQRFQFRAVVNGAPLSDGVVASVDLSNAPMISVSLVAPIQCVTGNTVRVQVQNNSGTSNVTIQDLSQIIS